MITKDYEFTVRLVNGSRVKEYPHAGSIYIEGRKGSEYLLTFRNKTNTAMLASFSVDGLSVMDGKTAGQHSQGYVVPAYGYVEIPGWRINANKVAAFQFQNTDNNEPTTYVEKLKNAGFDVDVQNQGHIGVMVWFEKKNHISYTQMPFLWGHTTVVPVNYDTYNYHNNVKTMNINASGTATFGSTLSASAQNSVRGDIRNPEATITLDWHEREVQPSVGTSFGKDKSFNTTTTTFVRETEAPTSISVIKYDSLQGLRRRGVPLETDPVSSAFPAYKNDGCWVPNR